MANNILTITGPNGGKRVEGTQAALDITDILDENVGIQTLHLVLKDTDGGFIGTSPLYIVQMTLDRQDLELRPLFPCPTPTWPPVPWNGTNPSYDPFGPPSEVPIDINKVFSDFWRDINYFWREKNFTDHSFDSDYRPIKNWGPYDENGNWNNTKWPIVIIPL